MNIDNIHDSKKLLEDFQKWHKNKRSYDSDVSGFKSATMNILKDCKVKWKVINKGTKKSPKYEETFGQGDPVPTNKYNYDLYTYFTNQFRKENYNAIEQIFDCLKEGDVLHALTIIDLCIEIANKIETARSGLKTGHDSFDDKRSALKLFKKYIDQFEHNEEKPTDRVSKIKSAINKPLVHKIDGALTLAKILGEEEFIRHALEQSYFFSSEVINERIKNFMDMMKYDRYLPARKTTKEEDRENSYRQKITETVGKIEYGLFTSETNDTFPIQRDKDGNFSVRSLIKDLTGYTACEGADSIFQNYIISHIWGRAYDPRYFTSLWNIVLVPAWANGLLDKQGEPGSLESKMKSTFMTVCNKLYDLGKDRKGYWDKINMSAPSIENPKDNILKGNNNIRLNIIGLKETNKLAPIQKKDFKV